MRTHRFAFYLIAESPELGRLRDETCAPFPTHLTVRGRFMSARSNIAELVVVGRETFRLLAPYTAEMVGPRVLDGGLLWYELEESSPAYTAIRAVHRQLDQEIVRRGLLAVDEVPARHQGDYYKPHVTVSFRGWDADRLAAAPRTVRVSFVEWGLFCYDGPADKPRLRCVFGEHLYANGVAPVTAGVPAWV